MIRICLIGAGNVAIALAREILENNALSLEQLICRNQNRIPNDLSHLPISNHFNTLPDCDFVLIAVSDNAIHEVSQKIPLSDAIVVHTSGASSIDLLNKHSKRGVMYPLQTFSQDRRLYWQEIPLLLEGNNTDVKDKLEKLSKTLSSVVTHAKEEERLHMHLAAVVVNNFTNHLYVEAEKFCKSKNLGFDMLIPLIEETTRKLSSLDPRNSQTGPASRGDLQTIERHKSIAMTNELADIYLFFTSQLLKQYNENI